MNMPNLASRNQSIRASRSFFASGAAEQTAAANIAAVKTEMCSFCMAHLLILMDAAFIVPRGRGLSHIGLRPAAVDQAPHLAAGILVRKAGGRRCGRTLS